MTDIHRTRRVPPRALALSLASLAVPVTGEFLLPGLVQDEYGVLVWMTVLVPAFLLGYYRGLRGVMIAASTGMVALSLTQVTVLVTGLGTPDWKLLAVAVFVFVVICAALAAFSELLIRERDRAERLALLDALTGLPNRRFADLTLDAQFAAAERGRRLAVILFDLDHFKRVNDKAGHDAGDFTLKAFAEVLRTLTRRMDLSARLGGEEFISILSDCPVDMASAFAEKVLAGLRVREFPWGPVTVSAGVAMYQKGMPSHEILVAAADRALYRAKQEGRDRVVTTGRESVRAPTPTLAASAPPETAPVSTGPGTPKPRILVVDDDRDVLTAVVKVLAAAGYQAEGTRDANIVRHRFESGGADIDLLVTDVIMPDMTGMVLVDLILPTRPDLPVVYMSGYVQKGGVTWAGLPGGTVGFVQKPVEIEDLLAAVRDVLTRAGAAAART